MTKEKIIELVSKINWEGGLISYLEYAGDKAFEGTPHFQLAQELRGSIVDFEKIYYDWLEEEGISPDDFEA